MGAASARSHASRVAKGALWSLTGTVISRGLAVVASIAVARIIGKASFGQLGVIQSTVGMFQAFAGLGLGITATKYVAELRHSDRARVGRIIALTHAASLTTGLLIAGVVVAIAPWLAADTLAAPQLTPSLQVGALLMLFGVVAGAQSGTLAGFEAFRAIARINVATGVATFPAMLVGAWLDGVRGAIVGSAIASALTCTLNHLAIARLCEHEGIVTRIRSSLGELAVLKRFSIPAMLSAILVGPVTWVCNAILVNAPDGYNQMGLFSAANQWRAAVLFIPGAIGTALLPVLSDLVGRRSWREYNRLLRANIAITAGLAITVAAPVALLSRYVMLGYGREFSDGQLVLVVLMASTVITSALNVVGQAIASLDRMWAGALLNAVWAIVQVIATRLLIHRGAVGLATAYLLSYAAHLVTVSLYAYWLLVKRVPRQGPHELAS